MIRILMFIIIAIIFFVLFYALIGPDSEESEIEGIRIVTTIYPYEILIRELIAERGTVTSLIPPNASPHIYAPNPGDMKLLESADLIVSNGLGLEVFLTDFLDTIIDRHISAAGFLPELKENEEEQHHTHSHGLNPHIWLDPVFLSSIVEGISLKLQKIDPEYREYYQERNLILQRDLNELNEKIMEQRRAQGRISLINFHDAFYYFNQRYDINSAATVVHSPGKEPTPRELTELGKIIEENDVRIILIEPQLNPKAAELIAREHKIEPVIVDPLGSYWQIETIVDLIYQYWETIRWFSNASGS
jgi:ABC-type Zn uptake system ZnuABC Zn-binding protein ZnuA